MNPFQKRIVPAVAILVLFLLSACAAPQSTAPTLAIGTPTQDAARPTPSPTPEPLGSPENPLVMAFAENDNQIAQLAAEEMARLLSEQSGFAVRSQSYPAYSELLQDMQIGRVHLAWLPPATYLYAQQRGFADARMVTNHFGVYRYGVQFLANANSGYAIYFDPVSGKNMNPPEIALSQFNGKTPCLLESNSLAGNLVPLGYLAEHNISWNTPLYLRSYTGIIRAIYITGICDFGVTFAISGDPRTSSAVQQDLTDAMQRVPIIWRSEEVIPNLGLAFLPETPSNLQASIIFALQDLAQTEDGKQLISTANNYEVQDMISIDDQYYQPLRELLAYTNTNLRDLIGK